MATLVIDIETIGQDFDSFDEVTKETLTKWVKRQSGTEVERENSLREIKDGTGLSPLTGEIVAIGVLDADKNKGAVYYQAPGQTNKEEDVDGVVLKQKTEKEMLQDFWEGAKSYDIFVTFNGRGFDIPYILVRSAVHRIKPTKNLMSNRYTGSQWAGAKHVDLMDQLSFYGATRKGSLHLWCRAFGIQSPKEAGVSGKDVAELFAQKKFQDIARYNIRDIVATKELYLVWQEFLQS